jgi:hypothetical protein
MQSDNETNESGSLDNSERSEKILNCKIPPIQPIEVMWLKQLKKNYRSIWLNSDISNEYEIEKNFILKNKSSKK